MVVHQMLAMGAGFLLSSASLQTADPPALIGIWESERCVIRERAGTRTSSTSRFVFLDDEWALELIQVLRRGVHDAIAARLLSRPVSSRTDRRPWCRAPTTPTSDSRASASRSTQMHCSPKRIVVHAGCARGHVVAKRTCQQQDACGSCPFQHAPRSSIW